MAKEEAKKATHHTAPHKNGKKGGKFNTVRRPQNKPIVDGEKKAKKQQPKKKKKAAGKKNDRTRDFTGDLETYLEEFAARESGESKWKFNKILQAWALDNCFYKKKMGSVLFKQLIPYMLTVQGGAMDRLVSRAAAIVSTDKSDIVDDDEALGNVTVDEKDDDKNDNADEGEEDEDAETPKKKEIIYKSMVSRAKKIQKVLNA